MELALPPAYTGPEPGSPEQVDAIIVELRRLYPEAACSLNFTNPLELLIATQLSAQCTDERVNVVTKTLYGGTQVRACARDAPERLASEVIDPLLLAVLAERCGGSPTTMTLGSFWTEVARISG